MANEKNLRNNNVFSNLLFFRLAFPGLAFTAPPYVKSLSLSSL